jgi:uncharacterized protein with von Willebrand factor type A (vWA) domain
MAKKNKVQAPTDSRVVVSDGFDAMAFESIADYERITELCQEPVAKDLVQDVFTSFYRTEAQIDEDKKASLTKDIVQEFHGMKEYADFHATSMLDSVASAFGSCSMAPTLVEKLKEIQKEIEEKREAQREQNKEDGKDENDGVPEGEPRLEEAGDSTRSGLRQAIRKAVDQAQQQNEDMQGLMRQWGVGPGEYKQMDPKERLELADQLKNAGKLKDVSQLLGRFKNVINSALATIPSHGSDEIVGIRQGDDIMRMLPTEMMKLTTNPMLFYKDFAEKNLLVYNLKGTENLGKGPVMVCWDRSGSMAGSREAWATAVVLALLGYATKENRAFAWVAFDDGVHDSAYYPKGAPVSLEEKVRVAQMGSSGGTSFYPALEQCMELHKQEPDLRPSDVIFITDGECTLSEHQLEAIEAWKKDKSIRIFGVGITDSSDYEQASFETLEQFSDKICMVNSLGDVSVLRDAVHQMHKNNGSEQ